MILLVSAKECVFMKFETLGRHILVEYYNCDEEVLKNPKLIEEFMNNSA